MSRYVINKDKVITINRGDYFERTFEFLEGAFPEEYPVEVNDDDIIFFGLMDPNQHFENSLIKKEFEGSSVSDDGLFTLIIDSEDTLELVPGVYYYSIKLLTQEGRIKTLIPKTKFIIVD